MFCGKCGARLDDGQRFCGHCGSPVNAYSAARAAGEQAVNAARDAFNNAERSLGSEFESARRDFSGNRSGAYGSPEPLKTDRSLLTYILLSIITCGFYAFYFQYSLAKDVNIACDGDGETTGGLAAYIILSYLTCGIYSWYWQYKLGNRLCTNAGRYGLSFQENGTTVLMWGLVGIVVCGIGPYVAMNILIKNTNAICGAYNRANGLSSY